MRNQRLIMNIKWYDKVRNVEIATQTCLPHIGTIIQRQRHALLGHVVRLDSDTPANQALALNRDINEGCRVPQGWRRPRGRPRTTWVQQMKPDTGLPVQPGDELQIDCDGEWTPRPFTARRSSE